MHSTRCVCDVFLLVGGVHRHTCLREALTQCQSRTLNTSSSSRCTPERRCTPPTRRKGAANELAIFENNTALGVAKGLVGTDPKTLSILLAIFVVWPRSQTTLSDAAKDVFLLSASSEDCEVKKMS